MNFAQIRAFHTVASEGQVARAASLIGVSQPTISQHIKALEARYGVQLFEKRGRGLALTPLGQDLYDVTKSFMQSADEVERALRRPSGLLGGRLHLISDSTGISAELLRRFRARNPSVELTLHIASMDAIFEAVQTGAADLGIALDPPASDEIVLEPLKRETFFVTSPRGHRFERMRQVPLPELLSETLIMREPGSRTRALIMQAMEIDAEVPKAVIEISERSAIREAIARGLGIGFFAPSECPPDDRLVHTPLAPQSARLDFVEYVIVRNDRRRRPVIAEFRRIATGFAAENTLLFPARSDRASEG